MKDEHHRYCTTSFFVVVVRLGTEHVFFFSRYCTVSLNKILARFGAEYNFFLQLWHHLGGEEEASLQGAEAERMPRSGSGMAEIPEWDCHWQNSSCPRHSGEQNGGRWSWCLTLLHFFSLPRRETDRWQRKKEKERESERLVDLGGIIAGGFRGRWRVDGCVLYLICLWTWCWLLRKM